MAEGEDGSDNWLWERERSGKERDTLLYYIGEIYRGEGKGDLPRKGEGEVFAGGNWGENREFNGNLTEIKRGLSKKLGGTLAGIRQESNKNWTEDRVNIVNAVGERFISGAERTKLWLRKDLLFGNKRLDLTEG